MNPAIAKLIAQLGEKGKALLPLLKEGASKVGAAAKAAGPRLKEEAHFAKYAAENLGKKFPKSAIGVGALGGAGLAEALDDDPEDLSYEELLALLREKEGY